MVESNDILYSDKKKPDHTVVIKYVPYVGDSKRAMDEYTSEIMMGGSNTLVIHNTCEDSLLASPLIIDLVVLAELCERITFKTDKDSTFQSFNSVLSILSYMCKAPLVPRGTPVVNALFKQKCCIENIMRACLGLAPVNHMLLEQKHERIANPIVPQQDILVKKANSVRNGENGLTNNGTTNGHVCNGLKNSDSESEIEK